MLESIESTYRSKLFWLTSVILILYLYFKKIVYSYWKRYGVPHDTPTVPLGTFECEYFFQKISFGESFRRSYEKYKKYPFHGLYLFHRPYMCINDPDLIKLILVKEFANFCDRGLYYNEKVDPLSAHLFFEAGNKWRTLRSKLSPTLTSGKLKNMFPLVIEVADEMIKVSNENLTKSDIIELKDLIARYTTDTIFSLAFGFNCNSLKNPDSEFRHYGNLSLEIHPLRAALCLYVPFIMDLFHIPFNNPKVSAFFIKLFQEMVDKRRKDKIKRKDFLNLLIELIDYGQIIDNDVKNSLKRENNAESSIKKLEILEAAAQAFVFFVAGFETSASIVTYCLYELSLNPDIQEKLYKEIDDVLAQPGGFSYEKLGQIEYLKMVYFETMRKHPSIPILNRVCINDYQMPNSNYRIPKGMGITISITGIHHDPDIYPEPDKFDPERFSKENIATRHPFAYLPFGEGPRICIGKRLGILQSKIALVTLLSNYKFSICEKTSPIEYSTNSILQMPKNGVYLRIEKRKVSNS